MAHSPEIRFRIPGFLSELKLQYESVGDTVWLIRDLDRGLAHVVVYADENLVTIRAKIMMIPDGSPGRFFEDLLRLNAEMLHGAYAIEEDSVIWIDTLEFETMDLEEFQASLDAASLSVMHHTSRLSRYASGGNDGNV